MLRISFEGPLRVDSMTLKQSTLHGQVEFDSGFARIIGYVHTGSLRVSSQHTGTAARTQSTLLFLPSHRPVVAMTTDLGWS